MTEEFIKMSAWLAVIITGIMAIQTIGSIIAKLMTL